MNGFRCSTCGEVHHGLPMTWGPNAPDAAAGAEKVKLTTDTCVIGRKRYFIRGCLDLPIRNEDAFFRWLVWVELPKPSYKAFRSIWRQLLGRMLPEILGSLAVTLPYDSGTLGLPVLIRDQGAGMRPTIALGATAHLLAVEQREGLMLETALEKAGRAMHAWPHRVA